MEFEKLDNDANNSECPKGETFLRLTYICLVEAKLIPIVVRKLSDYQVEKLIRSVTLNYVVDDDHPFAYFFEFCYN